MNEVERTMAYVRLRYADRPSSLIYHANDVGVYEEEDWQRLREWCRDEGINPNITWQIEVIAEGTVRVSQYLEPVRYDKERGLVPSRTYELRTSTPPPRLRLK